MAAPAATTTNSIPSRPRTTTRWPASSLFGHEEYPQAPKAVVDEYADRQAKIQEQEKVIREYVQKLSATIAEALARQTEAYLIAAWRGGKDEKLDSETLQRWVEYLGKRERDHPLLKPWDDLIARKAPEAEVREFATLPGSRALHYRGEEGH